MKDDTKSAQSSPWLQKPLWATQPAEENLLASSEQCSDSEDELERHMSLFDLTCVGVGGTIGSGIFVLCGYIARTYAGPATYLCWLIAGLVSLVSGVCYAELAGRIPSAGSAYIYAYVAMGELPAVIAAACLTLEYLIASCAVARSWGSKVLEWIHITMGDDDNNATNGHQWIVNVLDPGYNFNTMACILSISVSCLLLSGVKESKAVMNFFTSAKVMLVTFMIIGGIVYFHPSNVRPLVPPSFGIAGVFRGATASFFGYIGYDEICCLAGEAQNPKQNLPISIMYTLITITTLYVAAAFVLTGMQPYDQISETSGFPVAFQYNKAELAAQITAVGELFTMPVVVLIGVMPQPRLQYALAKDGLLPPFVAKMDEKGNLVNGILISGFVLVLISSFVPFKYLNDLISTGILLSFNMTCSSLVMLRHESPPGNKKLLPKLLTIFNVLALVTAFLLTHFLIGNFQRFITGICFSLMIVSCHLIQLWCPAARVFGGSRAKRSAEPIYEDGYFTAPFVPFLPCIGCFFNWWLIAQLELVGILLLCIYLMLTVTLYFCYSYKHSKGNNLGWSPASSGREIYDLNNTEEDDEPNETDKVMHRSISLPKAFVKDSPQIS